MSAGYRFAFAPNAETALCFRLCVDDSGKINEGQPTVLTGYVASVESWGSFSDRWKAALDEPPVIKSFHMTDAMALKKEFKGWTAEARRENRPAGRRYQRYGNSLRRSAYNQ